MREPLSVSRLADIIDQARGKAPADLVIKSVGIFDLTSGDVTVGDIQFGFELSGTAGQSNFTDNSFSLSYS